MQTTDTWNPNQYHLFQSERQLHISVLAGQSFRSQPDSHFGPSRTVISVLAGQ
jgi:hypothetical protein